MKWGRGEGRHRKISDHEKRKKSRETRWAEKASGINILFEGQSNFWRSTEECQESDGQKARRKRKKQNVNF
jgi:hypothetical protein